MTKNADNDHWSQAQNILCSTSEILAGHHNFIDMFVHWE